MQVHVGAVAGLALAQREADLHVGAGGIEPGTDGVVGDRIGDDEGAPVGPERISWYCSPTWSAWGRSSPAPTPGYWSTRWRRRSPWVSSGSRPRGANPTPVSNRRSSEPRTGRSRRRPGQWPRRERGAPAVVAAGEEIDPETSGQRLHLDPVEQADGEERGIHRDAVHPGRHVRDAVEVVLGGRGAPPPKVDRLRAAGEPAPPEVHAGHLGEQVTHRRRVAPLDRVSGEDDAGERRPRTGGVSAGMTGTRSLICCWASRKRAVWLTVSSARESA